MIGDGYPDLLPVAETANVRVIRPEEMTDDDWSDFWQYYGAMRLAEQFEQDMTLGPDHVIPYKLTERGKAAAAAIPRRVHASLRGLPSAASAPGPGEAGEQAGDGDSRGTRRLRLAVPD